MRALLVFFLFFFFIFSAFGQVLIINIPDDEAPDIEEEFLISHGFFNIANEEELVADITETKPCIIILAGYHSDRGIMGNLSADRLWKLMEDVTLPQGTRIYLLGCWQGRDKKIWAQAFGIDEQYVYGVWEYSSPLSNISFLRHVLALKGDHIERVYNLFKKKEEYDFWYNIYLYFFWRGVK